MKRLTPSQVDCLVCLCEAERWAEKRHGVYIVTSGNQPFDAFHSRTIDELGYMGLITHDDGKWRITAKGRICASTGRRTINTSRGAK